MFGSIFKIENLKTLPNKLTIGRIIVIPLLLILYPLTHEFVFLRFVSAFLFMLAAVTDFFDGYLARKYNNVSLLGTLLDPIADKLLIAASVVVLTNAGYLPAFLAGLFICREIAVSGLRMAATEMNFSIRVSQLGKIKTAAQGVAFFSLLAYTGITIPVGEISVWIALIVSYISAIQYGYEFWQLSKGQFIEHDTNSDRQDVERYEHNSDQSMPE